MSPKASWHLKYRDHHLELRTDRKRLPSIIRYSDWVKEQLDRAPESRPVVAFDHLGRALGTDMDNEFPHSILNAESGAGKTSMLRLLGCQKYRDGGKVCIVDPKQFSHGWALHLDGVEYWRNPDEVHAGLLWLKRELERRNRAALEAKLARKPIPRFVRITLIFDESNMAFRDQRTWWPTIKVSGDPSTPPAINALLGLLQAGRQVRVHVILVTQHGTARGLGDQTGEIRAAFGTRMFAWSDKDAWKLLAPAIKNPPTKSEIQGRLWIVKGSSNTEGQSPFLTDDEAELLALTSRFEGVSQPVSLGTGHSPPPAQGPGTSTLGTSPGTHSEPDEPELAAVEPAPPIELVSLRDASMDKGRGLVPVKLATLSKARTRAKKGQGIFPAWQATEGNAELFDLAELRAWAQERERKRGGAA